METFELDPFYYNIKDKELQMCSLQQRRPKYLLICPAETEDRSLVLHNRPGCINLQEIMGKLPLLGKIGYWFSF
jgi:hypothetical protein